MVRRGETEWESRLVARSTLNDLMADLRLLGMRGLCLDPGGGGPGRQSPSMICRRSEANGSVRPATQAIKDFRTLRSFRTACVLRTLWA
jgi:hypothetical protein